MAAAGGLESRMPPVGRIQQAWDIHLRWRHSFLRVSHSKEPLAAISHYAACNRQWLLRKNLSVELISILAHEAFSGGPWDP